MAVEYTAENLHLFSPTALYLTNRRQLAEAGSTQSILPHPSSQDVPLQATQLLIVVVAFICITQHPYSPTISLQETQLIMAAEFSLLSTLHQQSLAVLLPTTLPQIVLVVSTETVTV